MKKKEDIISVFINFKIFLNFFCSSLFYVVSSNVLMMRKFSETCGQHFFYKISKTIKSKVFFLNINSFVISSLFIFLPKFDMMRKIFTVVIWRKTKIVYRYLQILKTFFIRCFIYICKIRYLAVLSNFFKCPDNGQICQNM